MSMSITNIRQLCYELYKLDWMRQISTDTQMDVLKDYFEDNYEAGIIDEDYSIEDYIFENGYHGSLYVCFNEFLGAEYRNEAYMEELLFNDDLFKIYKEDLFQLVLDEDRAKGENL